MWHPVESCRAAHCPRCCRWASRWVACRFLPRSPCSSCRADGEGTIWGATVPAEKSTHVPLEHGSGLSVRVEVPNATDVADPVLAYRAPLACASLALRCLTGARFTSHRDCEACHATWGLLSMVSPTCQRLCSLALRLLTSWSRQRRWSPRRLPVESRGHEGELSVGS